MARRRAIVNCLSPYLQEKPGCDRGSQVGVTERTLQKELRCGGGRHHFRACLSKRLPSVLWEFQAIEIVGSQGLEGRSFGHPGTPFAGTCDFDGWSIADVRALQESASNRFEHQQLQVAMIWDTKKSQDQSSNDAFLCDHKLEAECCYHHPASS